MQKQFKVEYISIKVNKQSFTKKKCEKSHKDKLKSFKNIKASSFDKCFLCK